MSDERLLALTRAMADAVRSGLPPAQTLRKLAGDYGRGFKAAADSVEGGGTLHGALAERELMPPLLLAVVRAGEESGKLDAFLDRFAAVLESRIDFKRRIVRALAYPAFALLLAAGLFLAFATKAGPLLLQPLLEAGAPLPKEAFAVMKLGDWIVAKWPLLLGCAVLALLALRLFARSAPGRAAWALAGYGLPGVRFATQHARWYELENTLELLLAAGLRPRQIVEILRETFRSDLVARLRLSTAARLLTEGKTFSESLGPCLPADDRPRFETAERAGTLDDALKKLAQGHRDAQLHRLKLAAMGIQLAALVCLAPMVFALLLAVVSPTLASFGTAQKALASIEPAPAAPARLAAPRLSAPSSDFNERQARKVVGYMREHGAREPKKFEPPKLKARKSIKGLNPTSLEPSSLQGFN